MKEAKMATKKSKTIDLGTVRKGEYGPYFSFDKQIKSVTFEREYEIDGDKISEKVTVPVNDKGYLSSAYINKTEDLVKFKESKGWIDEAQAEKMLNNAKEWGISSYFSVKVES